MFFLDPDQARRAGNFESFNSGATFDAWNRRISNLNRKRLVALDQLRAAPKRAAMEVIFFLTGRHRLGAQRIKVWNMLHKMDYYIWPRPTLSGTGWWCMRPVRRWFGTTRITAGTFQPLQRASFADLD
jgi:hypothetical protein